jgi:hypothetical protein
MLSVEQSTSLRRSYFAGDRVPEAATKARTSITTVYTRFALFAARGLERGQVKGAKRGPKTKPVRKYPPTWHVPAYTGPEWIGKAIDTESRI